MSIQQPKLTRLSQYFLPTMREAPTEAKTISHQLMLRAGLIQQTASGIYAWLPLGFRVLKKIEKIIREEQDRIGAIELLMPTIQSADLWQRSNRYDNYGKEMLRVIDRNNRNLLYGPTNEEQITDIFALGIKSYRNVPCLMYHMQWKFRDEVRPRFGVLRGREFYMKDAYSFDLDMTSALDSYNKFFIAYLRTFTRIGVKIIPMKADTGLIGGESSHEFTIIAPTGESQVFFHRYYLEHDDLDILDTTFENRAQTIKNWTKYYAATENKHNKKAFAKINPTNQIVTRGIEIGHIFYFGTKYSKPLGAFINHKDGISRPVHMGSYGIGISRLIGAIIEVNHDKNGIIWPTSIAPFDVYLININVDSLLCNTATENIVTKLLSIDLDILYDDRSLSVGTKFVESELLGIPWRIVISKKVLQAGNIELKSRRDGKVRFLTSDVLISILKDWKVSTCTVSLA